MSFSVVDASIDLTLEGSGVFNQQCSAAISQLNNLRGGMAASDTGAKGFLKTLRDFQSNSGLGLLLKGGIYGVLATGAVNALTDITRAAKEGASGVDILSKGIYGFVTSLPLVGRLATAFRGLADEITGAREAKEALDKAMVFKKATGDMEEDIRRRMGTAVAPNKEAEERNKINNQYKDDIDKLNVEQKKYESTMERRLKLQGEIQKLEKMSAEEVRKYNEATPGVKNRYERDVTKKKDELIGLGPELKYQEVANGFKEVRDFQLEMSKFDEADAAMKKKGIGLTKQQAEAEKELAELKKINANKNELRMKQQEAREKHEEIAQKKRMKELEQISGGLSAFYGESPEDKIAREAQEYEDRKNKKEAKKQFEDVVFRGRFGDVAADAKAAQDELAKYEKENGPVSAEDKKNFLIERLRGMAGEGGMAERAKPTLNINSPAAAWASITNSINRQQDNPKEATQKRVALATERMAKVIEQALIKGGGKTDAVQLVKDIKQAVLQGG
jgi:hypothetical protein